jgi:hypothetical protein
MQIHMYNVYVPPKMVIFRFIATDLKCVYNYLEDCNATFSAVL